MGKQRARRKKVAAWRATTTALQARAPLISVIIPCYNSAAYLAQAIESVLAQSFLDFEIIVIDDGSTDDTPEVVGGFGDLVRYMRQENRGNAAARNTGLLAARGQWLCFLDAHDLWEPRKLELQLVDLLSHPHRKISFTRATKFFETGDFEPLPPDPTIEELWDKLVFYQPFGSSHSGFMVHSSCFDDVGCFDESLRLSVDWDIFIRLAHRYPIRVYAEFLVHHRQHASNTTGNAELRLSMSLACLRKHRRLFCIERSLRRQWHESYGARLFRFGRHLLKRGRYHESLRLLVRALRFGGRHNIEDKLKLLLECHLRYLGAGWMVDRLATIL